MFKKVQKDLVMNIKQLQVIVLTVLGCNTDVSALENGNSSYANGAENFMTAMFPSPGVYGMVYSTYSHADRLNDHNGNKIPIENFEVTTTGLIPRFMYVTEAQPFGGTLMFETLIPLIELDVKSGNKSEKKTGIADVITGVALGYRHTPNLSGVFGVDYYFKTGEYDKNDLANIGMNRNALDIFYTATYLSPEYIADIKVGYILNGKNKATDYKSADQFHFDYSIGKNIENYTFGVGGYYSTQFKNDKQYNLDIENSRTTGFSIGPSFKYNQNNWFMTLKWEKELIAENKTKGNSFWLKLAFPKIY